MQTFIWKETLFWLEYLSFFVLLSILKFMNTPNIFRMKAQIFLTREPKNDYFCLKINKKNVISSKYKICCFVAEHMNELVITVTNKRVIMLK